MGNYLRASWKNAFLIALGTFFLAVLINIGSQALLEELNSVIISFALLLGIILLGIVFDIIGVAAAAAAAKEAPLHAQAAKQVYGAREGINIIRNADKVGSFCSDVVGDICGTLSGAIGVSIIMSLFINKVQVDGVIWTTVMTAFVAALTVGGKAWGKTLAIARSSEIILLTGKLLHWLNKNLGLRILAGNNNVKRRKKR